MSEVMFQCYFDVLMFIVDPPRRVDSSLNSKSGLVTWPFCGQITRFWLFYFLFGLEKNVWPFGSILAFYQVTGIFTIF